MLCFLWVVCCLLDVVVDRCLCLLFVIVHLALRCVMCVVCIARVACRALCVVCVSLIAARCVYFVVSHLWFAV